MKRFEFSLERVLGWRRMQARVERMRWEQLRGELRAIEIERENLRRECERAKDEMQAAGSAKGEELAALDRFRQYGDAEQVRLQRKWVESEKRMAAQAGILAGKDRAVKVLEHLRKKKQAAWTAEWERETEQMAAEGYLTRWHLREAAQEGVREERTAMETSRTAGTNVK
jgi:hypothetical protein